MPAFFMRHSATLIPTKISRILTHANLSYDYFMKHFIDIEHDLNEKVFDKSINEIFKESKGQIETIFENLKSVSSLIDKTLEGTVNSTLAKSLQQIEFLEKKVNSAQKRNHSVIYNQYKHAKNLTFPENALQERIFSAVSFVNFIGLEEFRRILQEISKLSIKNHIIINLQAQKDKPSEG